MSDRCRGVNNYTKTFFDGLKRLYFSGDHSDIIIEVRSMTFKCHKAILAMMSSYFDSMFASGMRESQTGNVQFDDIEPEIFKKVLDFIYTGEIELDVDLATVLLHTSSFLQIQSLQSLCEEYLKPHVSTSNCVQLWKLATLNNCKIIGSTAFRKILSEFHTVSNMEAFFCLDDRELVEIIASDDLQVASEEELFRVVLLWLKQNSESLTKLDTILMNVRLAHARPEFLHQLEKMPEIRGNQKCLELINEAKLFHLLPARQHERENKNVRIRTTSEFENVIVVLGGCEATKPPYTRSTNAYCYSFRHKDWFTVAPLPYDPGIEFAAVTYRNDIYVSGGGMKQNSFLWYDANKNVWTELPSMINGRRRHASVAMTDVIYVLGGYDSDRAAGTQIISNIEKYQISEGRWEEAGELVVAVSCFTAVFLDDKILTFGGEDSSRTDTSVIQCYDVITRESTKLSVQIPMECKLTRSCVINSRIFLVFYDGRVIEYFEDRENLQSSCKVVGQFHAFQRTHFGVVQHEGNVVIVGGVIENTKPCEDFLMFNTKSLKCSVLEDKLFTPRLVDGCVKLNIPKKHLNSLKPVSLC